MSSDAEPEVPVVCPVCDTTTRVPLPEVADAIARHNEGVHDGDDVAEVDPAVADAIADLAASDLGMTDGTD
ncbi:MAG: hypothetical protein ABEJ61_07680 [Haloferacaceae archaeon]